MSIPNQSPDSTVAGYLQPTVPALPVDDDGLENFFQQWIAGIAGLDGTVVFPRWQPEPPNYPDLRIADWASIGITRTVTDTFAWIGGNDPNYDLFLRHQEFDISCSFYGPHSTSISQRLNDGLQVAQNREILLINEMGLIEVGEQRRVPDLVRDIWVDREDLDVRVRRRIVRYYPVRSLLQAQGTVQALTPGGLVFPDSFVTTPITAPPITAPPNPLRTVP